jgi:hypothetical protein
MDKRKERARLAKEFEERQKEMTPEEIEALQEQIPEWKRTALVLADDEEDAQKGQQGFFSKAKGRIGEAVSGTEAAKNFYQSEEYKQLNEVRKEVKAFKSEVKE